MSAFLAVPTGDVVHVLTDGAACDTANDGRLMFSASKQWIMPKQNAVLVIQGSTIPGRFLQEFLQANSESFDELQRIAGTACRDWYVNLGVPMARAQNMPGSMSFIAYVAGISETRGPSVFFVRSADLPDWCGIKSEGEDYEVNVVGPGEYFYSPVPPGLSLSAPFDPAIDGVRFLEGQRRVLQPDLGVPNIGGFIQHTEIMAAGISTRIIHRWPDEIGKVIAPFDAAA